MNLEIIDHIKYDLIIYIEGYLWYEFKTFVNTADKFS